MAYAKFFRDCLELVLSCCAYLLTCKLYLNNYCSNYRTLCSLFINGGGGIFVWYNLSVNHFSRFSSGKPKVFQFISEILWTMLNVLVKIYSSLIVIYVYF